MVFCNLRAARVTSLCFTIKNHMPASGISPAITFELFCLFRIVGDAFEVAGTPDQRSVTPRVIAADP
ncbi:hypothetical protein SAMN05216369_2675 [Marinobacter antarcticus]|uniref:Uncharacterized protein n=1 Tax=Marinobacter antarcticus TaxID=564117 RepID=A0A1M6U8X7_9GAMM|nr:hypothetical protein SAMN05216369_2675 [Marinobacter antarcticus]